jgi:hypothetical protein
MLFAVGLWAPSITLSDDTAVMATSLTSLPVFFLSVQQVKVFLFSALPEMELLDICLTKDSSLLLHAIHSPFYWRILKKTILFSGIKIFTKKFVKQDNLRLFYS